MPVHKKWCTYKMWLFAARFFHSFVLCVYSFFSCSFLYFFYRLFFCPEKKTHTHILQSMLFNSSSFSSLCYLFAEHTQYLSSFSKPICLVVKCEKKNVARGFSSLLLLLLRIIFFLSILAGFLPWKSDTNREIALKAVISSCFASFTCFICCMCPLIAHSILKLLTNNHMNRINGQFIYAWDKNLAVKWVKRHMLFLLLPIHTCLHSIHSIHSPVVGRYFFTLFVVEVATLFFLFSSHSEAFFFNHSLCIWINASPSFVLHSVCSLWCYLIRSPSLSLSLTAEIFPLIFFSVCPHWFWSHSPLVFNMHTGIWQRNGKKNRNKNAERDPNWEIADLTCASRSLFAGEFILTNSKSGSKDNKNSSNNICVYVVASF